MKSEIFRKTYARFAACLICLAGFTLLASTAYCQSDGYLTDQNRTGVVQFGSYHFGDIDSVDLKNGGVNLRIPLVTMKGRGQDEGLQLTYSTKFWTMTFLEEVANPTQNVYSLNWGNSFTTGPQISLGGLHSGRVDFNMQIYNCKHWVGSDYSGNPIYVYWNVQMYSNFQFTSAGGTKHIFPNRLIVPIQPPIPSVPLCYNNGAPGSLYQQMYDFGDGQNISTGMADSGNLQLQTAFNTVGGYGVNSIVIDKHGRQIYPEVTDTNGNVDGWPQGGMDTAGRPFPQFTSNPDGSYTETIADSNGQLQPYTFYGQAITGNPQFPSTMSGSVPIYSLPNGWIYHVLSKVVLPNGLSYQFSYQLPDGSTNPFGEITKVILPSGGYIRYVYSTLPSFDLYDSGEGYSTHIDSRRVVERDVSTDGVTEQKWTYQYTANPGGIYVTNVTDPLGNVTVHTFNTDGETQTKILNASSTLLKQIDNVFTHDDGPVQANQIRAFTDERQLLYITPYILVRPRNIRILSTTTTLPDTNQVSQTQTVYDSETYTFDTLDSGGTNLVTYNDTQMNPVELDEYDYGTSSPGQLLRKTTYAYLHNTNSTYLNLHMLDLVASKTIYNGAGTQLALTQYEYDNYTQGLTASGATQHNSTFNTSYLTRGNQTAVSMWRNTDGAMLTTRNQYDDAGNILSTTDPGGHTTSFDYTDTWTAATGGNTCAPASGQAKAYVTRTTNALGQQSSSTYFSCSGLVGSTTDPNSQTVTESYDLFGRLLNETRPDGGTTNWTYTDASNQATRTVSIGGGVQPHVTQFNYDGLERVNHVLLTSDPDGTVHSDTTYDSIGRVSTASNPYRSTSDSTYGITSTAYDGLGRATTLTSQDGGVVTSTYSGNSVTVTDQAGKQRRSFSDGLGRLIEVDEPGLVGTIPATSGTGSVTVSGTELTAPGSGTPGSGTVTISGTDKSYAPTGCRTQTCRVYDSGSVTVTVGSLGFTLSYGQTSSASGIASTFANDFNAASGSPVTASVSGSVITFTSIATGASTNYTLSASSSSNDSTHFSPPSFTTSTSGSTLTGGAAGPTVYDAGTVSITVNGFVGSATYGQSSTTSSIATSLVSALSASGSPVTASANGNVVTITSIATGTAADYSLSASSASNNSASFPTPSFSASASGSTLTGGTNSSYSSALTLATPAITLYTYDALDNLTQVVQQGRTTDTTQWRTRNFAYDSLSRLLSATNPESGTITYTYDADGNVLTKTDARNITTTYAYDQLHRLTNKTYSDSTPVVTIAYDGQTISGCSPTLTSANPVGRRTAMCDAAGWEAWSYDTRGRVAVDRRNTNSLIKDTSYSYNNVGGETSVTYPSGRTISYIYNPAAQVVSASDVANNITYASNAHYSPAGGLAFVQEGSAGINSTYIFNNRLQPCWMSSTSGAPQIAWNTTKCTDTAAAGNILDYKYNFNLGAADNGNVAAITNNINSARSQSFTYDQLNRLLTANTQATTGQYAWGLSFGYDAWANLLNASVSQGSAYSLNVSATGKNQLSGYTYDPAGNMLNDGTNTYTFDAENKIKNVAGVTYTYDGDGNRVQKSNGKLYWNGGGADPLNETDASGNLTDEYIFFGGRRIARRDPGNSVDYYFADHLGTARVVTNASGTVQDDSDFYPFGGERPYLSSSGNTYKFTGKERDSESGFDDFGARHYSSSLGRFASSDWSTTPDPVPYADFVDPQTLNLYAYVGNNPLSKADLDGHGWWKKFKNLFSDAACWCEGQEAEQRKAEFRARRAQLNRPMSKEEKKQLTVYVTVIIIYNAADIIANSGPVDNPEENFAAANSTGDREESGAVRPKWSLGDNKSAEQWQNQMEQRGWTQQQIDDAISHGQQFPAVNNINPANGATRYVNPETGRSVVLDNKTGQVIHVGGDGFKY